MARWLNWLVGRTGTVAEQSVCDASRLKPSKTKPNQTKPNQRLSTPFRCICISKCQEMYMIPQNTELYATIPAIDGYLSANFSCGRNIAVRATPSRDASVAPPFSPPYEHPKTLHRLYIPRSQEERQKGCLHASSDQTTLRSPRQRASPLQ